MNINTEEPSIKEATHEETVASKEGGSIGGMGTVHTAPTPGGATVLQHTPYRAGDLPIEHHTQVMRQMGVQNHNQLLGLHEVLDKLSMKIKLKKMTEGDEDMSVLKSNKEQW